MQRSVMGAVGVGFLFAACAPRAWYKPYVDHVLATHVRNGQSVAAPAVLESQPWKVGQWALYRGGVAASGVERISVVAIDGCGIWIADVSTGYDGQDSWTICFSPVADPSSDPWARVKVAIVQSGDGPLEVIDFRHGEHAHERVALGPRLARLFPPHWPDPASLAREDLEVPAGHFEQTVHRTTLDGRTSVDVWSHPAVPFDGTVEVKRSDGRELVLIGFGDDGAAQIVQNLTVGLDWARRPAIPPVFFGFGAGFSWFSGASTEQGSRGYDIRSLGGTRVTPTLDLMAELDVTSQNTSPDPAVNLRALFGVRWMPFRSLRFERAGADARCLYLRGGFGYTALGQSSTTDTSSASGLAVGAAVGCLVSSNYSAIGVEVDAHLALIVPDNDVRRDLGVFAFYQYYVPWFR